MTQRYCRGTSCPAFRYPHLRRRHAEAEHRSGRSQRRIPPADYRKLRCSAHPPQTSQHIASHVLQSKRRRWCVIRALISDVNFANRLQSAKKFPSVIKGENPTKWPTIKYLEENLAQSIATSAPQMTWDPDLGEPATDILHARLRAKFYGARVITYRPILTRILKATRPRPVGTSATKDQIDPAALEYAQKGLAALIHSTTAFHHVVNTSSERLIVTNIWGTAHA